MNLISLRSRLVARAASGLSLVVFSLLLLTLAPRAVFGQG